MARCSRQASCCLAKKRLHHKGRKKMLLTIGIIMIVLWLLGLITTYTIGGFIHILLVVAVIMILIRIIRGKKVL